MSTLQTGAVRAAQSGEPARLSGFSRRVRVALVVWLAILGLDFLLNGAVFAGLYQAGGPFMLAPAEAFRRIPFGYLAFLVLALGIVEAAYRMGVTRTAGGVRLGVVMGAASAAVWSLSLWSISTLSPMAALAFGLVWFALIVLASALAVNGLGRASLRGLVARVVAFDVLCAVTVIALQSFGVVPTLRS